MPEPIILDSEVAKTVGGWAASILTLIGGGYAAVRIRKKDVRGDSREDLADELLKEMKDQLKEAKVRLDEIYTKYNDQVKTLADSDASVKVLTKRVADLEDEIKELQTENSGLRAELKTFMDKANHPQNRRRTDAPGMKWMSEGTKDE